MRVSLGAEFLQCRGKCEVKVKKRRNDWSVSEERSKEFRNNRIVRVSLHRGVISSLNEREARRVEWEVRKAARRKPN